MNKVMTKLIKALFLFLYVNIFTACISSRPLKSSSMVNNQPMVRPVTFETRRGVNPQNQFKPRVLVIKNKANDNKIPEEWSLKAEKYLWKQLERADTLVLLNPDEVKLDLKDAIEKDQWDWEKINSMAKEKSIPLILSWELMPLQLIQETDPVGILRERRRRLLVKVKVKLMDSRKGTELVQEIGTAIQKEKDILWFSKNEDSFSISDYDPQALEELLKSSIDNTIPTLLSHIPKISWTGRVAMIKGDRLYLNVGRQSGLQVGDILKVLDVSDEVFDPESGESIGKIPGRMKGTLEIISYFGQDGSVAVVHSGAGFQENDSIEYY